MLAHHKAVFKMTLTHLLSFCPMQWMWKVDGAAIVHEVLHCFLRISEPGRRELDVTQHGMVAWQHGLCGSDAGPLSRERA